MLFRSGQHLPCAPAPVVCRTAVCHKRGLVSHDDACSALPCSTKLAQRLACSAVSSTSHLGQSPPGLAFVVQWLVYDPLTVETRVRFPASSIYRGPLFPAGLGCCNASKDHCFNRPSRSTHLADVSVSFEMLNMHPPV